MQNLRITPLRTNSSQNSYCSAHKKDLNFSGLSPANALEEVLAIAKKNPYLTDCKIGDILDLGKYYLVLSQEGISHFMGRHLNDTFPGSKFNKDIDAFGIIKELLTKTEPNEIKTIETEKFFNWIAVDTGKIIGVDNLRMMQLSDIPYLEKCKIGSDEIILRRGEQGPPTSHMSIITANVGEYSGKPILSFVTAFPGEQGAGIPTRNDLTKAGYCFLVPSDYKVPA